jgi:hypothetical protein
MMGKVKEAMSMAEEWYWSECYPVDEPNFGYVRADPAHAKKIADSNWEAGHMGQSFSPTCTYEFADGSKLEIGYSYAVVVG